MKKDTKLVNVLEKITEKTFSSLLQNCTPLPISDNIILVGNAFVRKNKNSSYDILSMSKKMLYKDIVTLDIAVIIAKKYSLGKIYDLKKVLALENEYAKFYFDMLTYASCMKRARKNADMGRVYILDDKYNEAKLKAANIKKHILVFK
jgi:hypothetical protein